MTSQEKYKLIEEVCAEIKASLQREADRLTKLVENYGEKNSPEWRCRMKDEATDFVLAQINVSGVQTRMQMKLIPEIIEETKPKPEI